MKMQAVVLKGVGGADQLDVKQVDVPRGGEPGPGELLVRVRAAAVNPIDYKLRQTGAAGIGAGRILGVDAAGEVEKVGPGVEGFAPGDRVFYAPELDQPGGPGGYAQYNMPRAKHVSKLPARLDFVKGAAMALAGMTAWESVMNRGGLRAGETVLIAAANGGVGSVAVQIAKAAGAFVIGTCSARSMEFVKSIPVVGGEGPDAVFDYTAGDWSAAIEKALADGLGGGAGGLDLVFDAAGKDVLMKAMKLLKKGADDLPRMVTIVNPEGKLEALYRTNITLHYVGLIHKRPSLEPVRLLLERGQLTPLIDSVMKLEEVAEAHRRLEAGGVKGKIVLEVP